MKNINIRPALEGDLPAIIALVVELSNEIDGADATDSALIEWNVQETFRDPKTQFLVAHKSGRVVGFVNFTTRRTIIHPSSSGLIDELIVSREYRGEGIGSSLISGVVARCREMGCCELEVSTLMSNEKARNFYKKQGFDEESVLLEMQLDIWI